jgi:hypothetical protein
MYDAKECVYIDGENGPVSSSFETQPDGAT